MQTNERDLAARDTEDCYVFIHTFTYVSKSQSSKLLKAGCIVMQCRRRNGSTPHFDKLVDHIGRVFLPRPTWIVNYYVKNPVKNSQ